MRPMGSSGEPWHSTRGQRPKWHCTYFSLCAEKYDEERGGAGGEQWQVEEGNREFWMDIRTKEGPGGVVVCVFVRGDPSERTNEEEHEKKLGIVSMNVSKKKNAKEKTNKQKCTILTQLSRQNNSHW